MEKRNLFLQDYATKTKGYKFYEEMVRVVQQKIADGYLKNMIDISNILPESEKNYIDCHHYSPSANKEIAKAIHNILRDKKLLVKNPN